MATASGISFSGLASGLDTKAIIEALVGVRAKPIQLLETRKAQFQDVKKQFQVLRDRLNALRTAAQDLSDAGDLVEYASASSDDKVLGASISGNPGASSFNVTVNALAKAQVVASQGYADFDTTTVGTGTLKVTVAGVEHDVAIGAGEDTLEGLRDAINDADLGVKATIVNEGSGASPYRLVLTSEEPGTANSIALDASGLAGGGAALAVSTTQAATDASVTVNGLTFTRSSNSIDDVVEGVTLDLKSEGSSTVTTSVDQAAVKTKVEAYVKAHNDLIGFINSQLTVSGTTNKAGSLSGESAVRNVKNKVLNLFGSAAYPGGSLTTPSAAGLSVAKDGTVTFDAQKFEDAFAADPEGVVGLLATRGDSAAGAGFSLIEAGDAAYGTHAVAVTQAATKAEAAAADLFEAGGLGQDETLTITQGDKTVQVELTAGDTLSQALTKIKKAVKDEGLDLVVGEDGGALTFKAKQYGAAQSFSVVSNVAAGDASSGVGTAALDAEGQDVAGTIGGVAATGEGQVLKGTGAYDGVELRYTGDGPGTGSFTAGADGFFVALEEVLDDALLPLTGPIDARLDGLDDVIGDIDDRVDSLEDRLEQYRRNLERQFAALESVLSGLQQQQSALAAISTNLFASNKK